MRCTCAHRTRLCIPFSPSLFRDEFPRRGDKVSRETDVCNYLQLTRYKNEFARIKIRSPREANEEEKKPYQMLEPKWYEDCYPQVVFYVPFNSLMKTLWLFLSSEKAVIDLCYELSCREIGWYKEAIFTFFRSLHTAITYDEAELELDTGKLPDRTIHLYLDEKDEIVMQKRLDVALPTRSKKERATLHIEVWHRPTKKRKPDKYKFFCFSVYYQFDTHPLPGGVASATVSNNYMARSIFEQLGRSDEEIRKSCATRYIPLSIVSC